MEALYDPLVLFVLLKQMSEVILKTYISACYFHVAVLVWISVVMVNVSHGSVVQRRHACFVDIDSTGGCLSK